MGALRDAVFVAALVFMILAVSALASQYWYAALFWALASAAAGAPYYLWAKPELP